MADLCSGFNGTATVQRTPDGPVWLHADAGVHVADELLDLPLLLEKYEIGGRCPVTANQHHARLRDA